VEPGGPEVNLTLTRERPPDGWKGFDRRIDAPMLAAAGVAPEMDPDVYVCGPTPMVEAVANALVGLGHEPARIRTERFGPTGEG
jgi:ferredoxin-NADP reductase